MALPQVAEYLRCSPSTVGRLLKKRDIPAFRLGRDICVWQRDIDALAQ